MSTWSLNKRVKKGGKMDTEIETFVLNAGDSFRRALGILDGMVRNKARELKMEIHSASNAIVLGPDESLIDATIIRTVVFKKKLSGSIQF